MEKKLIFLIFLVVAPFVIASSIPQFLIFQGEAKLDGRITPQGTIVNFSIEGTEIANAVVDESGQYGPIIIQGFSEHFGKEINITIDGYEAEQKIDYVYPQDIFLDLSALTEKALKISDSSPVENIISVSKTGELSFNVITDSGYDDPVNHTWFLDGDLVSNTNLYSHKIGDFDKGKKNITIIATDGFLTVSKEWTLIIERPEIENFDGDTTDLDSIGLNELESVENLVLEKTQIGKIEFLENLNLSGVTDLNNKVKIEKGIVAIDTSFYPQLNKPARITLTGVSYRTIPEIFFTEGFTTNPLQINKECDFCKIISHTKNPTNDGIVIFEVEHFSSFKVGESGNKHNLSLFDDLDTCRVGVQGDLILEIKDPDEGDEFGPGEKIEIKVNVENNADEEKEITVEASLYNINEDDVEEETEDEKDINEGRDKKFELTLNVPEDFEDDDYLIFVKVFEDGKEGLQCDEAVVGIDLEREKHDVIIKEFSINPSSITAGKSFDVFVEVQNIGENDEDVYIVLEIRELGVLTESEIFELEEFGEDDSYSETLFIKIPENAEEGDYTFVIRVIFNGEKDEREETISILKKVSVQMEPIDLTIKETLKIEKAPQTQKAFEIYPTAFILLSIGIIILIILIVIAARRKK